ncbi:MAG: PKD domain-containing protein [Paludibacteraceae bacterium]|nr:PKD domain-containing protein [Paludibacteraceae bacterium]
MKNIIKKGIWILLSILAFAACSPQEDEKYSLGTIEDVVADMVSFKDTIIGNSPNVITFINTSQVQGVYTLRWDLGNGTTGITDTIVGKYPFAGTFTVKLTVYAPNGTSATKEKVITIEQNDYSLVNTPVYVNLTGGADDADGKTWVFDQYNRFASTVGKATGLDIAAHMGLGELDTYTQGWWKVQPNEKKDWKLYDFKFTFIQNGVQLKIRNEGEGYGRSALQSQIVNMGFTIIRDANPDIIFSYNGGDYTFSIDESGKYPKLTLSGNAFMGYYCGSQEYEIIYQTDSVMALRVAEPAEGFDWVFVYCLEELNVAAPPVVKEPKAIPLTENFESGEFTVNFVTQDMGTFSGIVDNPAPVGINISNKVYRYQKSDAFYSNLSFTAPDYKFDLTTQNKIRLKVYIPSYNDFITENAVAGDWIAEKRLRPQLAVKLQDSDMGGNAWQNQTEIVQKDIPLDRWVTLEFDFSNVSTRTDYDKIVIQFGGEGHAGSGIFFFDDFSFDQ